MSDKVENASTEQGPDLERRRTLWRALGAAPVILTLSTSPAWASHAYGHYKGDPPPGCDPPPDPNDPNPDPNCNPND